MASFAGLPPRFLCLANVPFQKSVQDSPSYAVECFPSHPCTGSGSLECPLPKFGRIPLFLPSANCGGLATLRVDRLNYVIFNGAPSANPRLRNRDQHARVLTKPGGGNTTPVIGSSLPSPTTIETLPSRVTAMIGCRSRFPRRRRH
jgi:hypothetical protein